MIMDVTSHYLAKCLRWEQDTGSTYTQWEETAQRRENQETQGIKATLKSVIHN